MLLSTTVPFVICNDLLQVIHLTVLLMDFWNLLPFPRFLDKAATVTDLHHSTGNKMPSPWHLTTVTQVEEVKIVIRLLPIWATTIVFATVYSQMSTLFVLQGERMNAHMGPNFEIPAASLSVFDTLSVLLWVPVYDRMLIPFMRGLTGQERGLTHLQRIGTGLVISIFAMVAAGVLEIERLKQARRHGLIDNDTDPVPLSIFWQIPQYFLVGAAEVFAMVGQIEFYFDQSPDAMRALGSALFLTTIALGNYLSTLLVTIVTHITEHGEAPGWIPDNLNRGHIDYFFWLLAVLSFLNLCIYLVVAKWYKYKKLNSDTSDAQAVAPLELRPLKDVQGTAPGQLEGEDNLFHSEGR